MDTAERLALIGTALLNALYYGRERAAEMPEQWAAHIKLVERDHAAAKTGGILK